MIWEPSNIGPAGTAQDFRRHADYAGLIPPWKPDSFRWVNHAEVIYEGLYGQSIGPTYAE